MMEWGVFFVAPPPKPKKAWQFALFGAFFSGGGGGRGVWNLY